MGLSAVEISRAVNSLQILEGAMLKEVYQPTQTELAFAFRQEGVTHTLLLSTHARLSRLHLVKVRPSNPAQPQAFQMLCRKELSGRLVKVRQIQSDRVVALTFSGASERVLVAELSGRHGNIYLLNDSSQVIGLLRAPRQDYRRLLPGMTYQPPALSATSPPQKDRFAAFTEGLEYLHAVASHFLEEERQQELEALRALLLANVRRQLKRFERLAEVLAADLERAEKAERHRRFGDLLQIYLKEVKKGMSRVVVSDLFETPPRLLEIPLEPLLEPVENFQRHYRLYRKLDASIPVVMERQEQTEAALARLYRVRSAIAGASSLEALVALRDAEGLQRAPGSSERERRKKEATRLSYHSYQNAHGAEIWVGRSARDNDVLTFRVARGNDFWLHVRGRPGAHVVIPGGGGTPDLETLLDAACLALKYSGLSIGDRGEVAYTRVKYVRRVPGGAPGLVTFSQDRSLRAEVSRERMLKLLRSEGEGEG